MTTISHDPPQDWRPLCDAHDALVASARWERVLADGFDLDDFLYAWDQADQDGVLVPVFKQGPLRVGYVGFPLGLTIRGRAPGERLWEAIYRNAGIHAAILPVNPFVDAAASYRGRTEHELESAIHDLQTWSPDASPGKRTRQNIRRALRMPWVVRDAGREDLPFISRVYQATVARHGAKARYGRSYFGAIIDLSSVTALAQTTIVEYDGRPVSYTVAIRHGTLAAYLHGGYEASTTVERPVDVGVLRAIQWAQEAGAGVFSMLRSPQSQPGLIRSKERWGGVETRPHSTIVASRLPAVARLMAWKRGWSRENGSDDASTSEP